ncbi:pogo transposable element, putative [Talaromyces stipitatus ATCC 10500]|uniref:Pogo transposable element, putative n=1 Tax=Talaromyces stipitatus (strain ATCC 10500 / CBS 375.48 / QM 6759 / NRRL 1006) TaxID=441959 RepID=B8MAM0_TALSN|nr:pogo transposable element, putative [Talaromyces stipitatus ATCC 10500]EED17444.1 pogo transposable element, putative [Talaromyces stipitatus ATCC 10500]
MTTEISLVRRHRLTPSFTDSAIDVELTEELTQSDDGNNNSVLTTSSENNAALLNQRIVHIAHLAANDDTLRGLSQDECAAVNKYLDNIEKLFDPRQELTRAIALNRPASPTSSATVTTSPANAALRRKSVSKTISPKTATTSLQQQTSRDLNSVLEQLSIVNEELRQRYLESRHIHDLFIVNCEGLAQRIIELENEVHELNSDILEDTIELEGLRGTVRGLDSWVNRWQRQREFASASPSSKSARRPKSRSYWRRKHKSSHDDEDVDDGNDFDTFLDGVLAWMRGWNDVEEGFLIRARRRKLRRERNGLISEGFHSQLQPLLRGRSQSASLNEQEGRILLAISDLQNGRIQRVAQAARIYEIPRTTLQDTQCHKLTQYEEESLVKWVLDLDRRGLPPRHSLVREMANYILSQHGKPQVGKNWITKLIKRRPEIDSKFARKYNYERAKCEDPKIIQEHFDRVQAAISEYGILPEDIFNFDETGFAMGLCATAKVITGSDRYAQPKLLQPGNREWVTAIEATNSTGWAVPSYVIFKAKKNVREGWFDDLPDDWRINISDNGWTTDQIGLEWLKTHFIPYINGRTVGKYRMLILDGHGSHLTPEFDHICTENNIIPVCMPPHSSHLLQPLDVGCFAVLKRHYGQLVEQRMRLGFNHIDKMDFLTAFPQARTVAYKAQTIRNSFAATGLVPFNPDRVIQQLNIRLKTPTPPPSRSSNTASSCLQTPQNIRQFIRQSTTINKRINERTESNQNQEINQAVVRLSKAYEMIANDVLLVRKENYDLRAAHEKEKQKRQKSKKQISIEQAVTKEEVQALVQGQVEASHAVTTTPAEPELPASQAVVRRQYRCSGCNVMGHRINQCPSRISS